MMEAVLLTVLADSSMTDRVTVLNVNTSVMDVLDLLTTAYNVNSDFTELVMVLVVKIVRREVILIINHKLVNLVMNLVLLVTIKVLLAVSIVISVKDIN